MTLREEVLKQAGLLNEMPMRATFEAPMDELRTSFLCFMVAVVNNKKTINIKENSRNKNYKKEIYDYIITSTKLSAPEANYMVENGEVDQISVNYDVKAFTNVTYDGMGEYDFSYSENYKGAEGEKLIRYIVGKLGKPAFIKEAKNILKYMEEDSEKKKIQDIINFINNL